MTNEPDHSQQQAKPLDFLFAFKGRIGRRQFLAGLGLIVVLLVCMLAAAANFMDTRGGFGLFIPLTFVLLIAIAWIHSAIVVKRLRDAGKPGWYYFIFGLGPFAWLFLTANFIESLWFLILAVFFGLIAAPAFFPGRSEVFQG